MNWLKKSGATGGREPRQWGQRIRQWMGLSLLACSLIFALGTIVFWDANFYAARDRWEHFKLALFDEWNSNGWCPPARQAPECKPKTSLEATLADVDNLHFFKSALIEGTNLTVTTGANFATAEDVVRGKAQTHWCYIAYGARSIKNRLELGLQTGDQAPVFLKLSDVGSVELSELGLNAGALEALAPTHCQFGVFNKQFKTDDF